MCFIKQTPKFLHFLSFHGRIRHKTPVLVSSATMEFNHPKFLHSSRISVLVSPPATMEFNPTKFLHFLQHFASKSVLVSPATVKFSPLLFALPRDNEEEPIIQEHGGASISSDNGEYLVREAELDEEFWASAWLKIEGLYGDQSDDGYDGSNTEQYAEMEFNIIHRWTMRYLEKFMCVIVVGKEGEDVLKNVIGSPDFCVKHLVHGETYPEELVKPANLFSAFKKSRSQRYGIISNVTIAAIARQQGVGSSMLKFAIETAKEDGIKQIFLQVRRDNKPALALYRKMGFEPTTVFHPQDYNPIS
ncbi:hypothetical protein MKX01_040395 [Papaver californicum]|nr:hypothetical protein MKX01_040395 [Papaver californicum]